MTDLQDPIWRRLNSAGGGVEQQLRRLVEGEGDFRQNMEELAENLSHQLSYYGAAYALPHLAALCPRLPLEDQFFLIALIGPAVAAESTQPLEPVEEDYRQFHQGLQGLRRQAEALIENPALASLLEQDPELGQQFALSALALIGDRGHAYGLYLLSGSCWQEGCALCECGWGEETLPMEEGPDCILPAQIGPWDGESLEEEAVWLQGLLALAGDEQILPILPLVYGEGLCPECGKREPYWAWLNRFIEEW